MKGAKPIDHNSIGSKDIRRLGDEVESIKRLLILYFIKNGSSSEEIGLALGVDSSVIRKMIPSSAIKKFEGR
jgi:hypothetical protein